MTEGPVVLRREVTTYDGARLVAEAIGDAGDPALLLLGGATWSMDWWDDDLCAALAERGLRVLRHDQRDTGGSTQYAAGEPPYSADDLARDALAVMTAFGVDRAHVLGLSMGGGLAQRLAVRHPDRVASLVLVSTTPADGVERDLPPPAPELLATFTAPVAPPDWHDAEAVVDWLVAAERPYAGPGHLDEPGLRALLRRVVDRTPDMEAASHNHLVVAERDAAELDLGAVTAPTLVVHGSHDPLFPLEHGEALARVLGAGPVLVLPDTGHQAPPRDTWPALVDAVVAHTTAPGR